MAQNNVQVTGRADVPPSCSRTGSAAISNLWRLVVPALAERFGVVLFDHVGAGGSEPSAWSSDRYSTLDGYATDVLEICAEGDLRDVVLVGTRSAR